MGPKGGTVSMDLRTTLAGAVVAAFLMGQAASAEEKAASQPETKPAVQAAAPAPQAEKLSGVVAAVTEGKSVTIEVSKDKKVVVKAKPDQTKGIKVGDNVEAEVAAGSLTSIKKVMAAKSDQPQAPAPAATAGSAAPPKQEEKAPATGK